MNNRKATKRALLTSIMALVMCVVMLVGTTFAWFTDTASTAVNKIQSGKLDVALEMSTDGTNWESAEGKTLTFKTKDNRAADKILWEPGCTYELPQLRVVNNGNLALKYKIQITGIQGDAKLNEVIDWTINDADINLTEEHLLAGQQGTAFTIKGHMQDTANNDYQNLTIDGIGITVVATQYTYENDSKDNTYDQDAEYPKTVADIKDEYGVDGLNMPTGVVIDCPSGDGKVYVTLEDEEAFLYFTQVFDKAAACAARKTALDNGAERYPGESVFNWLNIWYYENVYVELKCDVDLQNRVVTPFTACNSFDGKGHTIKNATVVGDGSNSVGFFGNFDVTDVKMDNIHVKADGNQYAGVISGFNSNAISKVTVTNSTVTGGKNTGAIVGNCYVDLENCIVENCVISGQYKVGGLAGYVCRENGNVLNIRNNTLTNVTVKGENLISGKSDYVIGQVVGNWNAFNGGECKGNTITNVTGATTVIGKVQPDVTAPVTQ